ncbi:MAG TPA: putative peptidoglycan-binding domain-containing protein [Thermoleophilaceae bacterium]|nr:putative peptidoglycan-binding domain-containing protein [Thermoleophilaceae bacterium]
MSLRALIRPAAPAAVLLLLALPSGASAAAYGSRTLAIGSHGADVKRLQGYLGTAGHRVARDGEFGPRTLRALRATERELELRSDGVATTREQRAIKLAVRVAGSGGAAYKPPPPPEQVVAGEDGKVTEDGFAVPPRSAPRVVKEVVAAGNEIAKTPYKWGGGHPRWNDTGYDCSGSVSFALHGAGLLDSPLVSGDFARWGDRGEGNWITVYANAEHMYMVVAGMRFDTSARSRTGSRWTMEQRPSSGFAVTHPAGL